MNRRFTLGVLLLIYIATLAIAVPARLTFVSASSSSCKQQRDDDDDDDEDNQPVPECITAFRGGSDDDVYL